MYKALILLQFIVFSTSWSQEMTDKNELVVDGGVGLFHERSENNFRSGLNLRLNLNYNNTGNNDRRLFQIGSDAVDYGQSFGSLPRFHIQHRSNTSLQRNLGNDNISFVLGTDLNFRLRYDQSNSPFIGFGNNERFENFYIRPVLTASPGLRITNGNVDFVFLPQVGFNLTDMSLIVGTRAGVSSERAFASILSQFNFSDNFDYRRDSSSFFLETQAGVRLFCIGGKNSPEQNTANGFCMSLAGEYERIENFKIERGCNYVCGEELNEETFQSFTMNIRFEGRNIGSRDAKDTRPSHRQNRRYRNR